MLPQEQKIYTYEEYLKISEHERCEYIAGQIYLMTSPNATHQRIIMRLSNIFYEFFQGKDGEPFIAPFDVELEQSTEWEHETVQPDIVVICDKHNINNKGRYKGTPTLVVEIVSPSNSSHDYVKKLDLYMRCGIKEYWIIDPREDLKKVLRYTFENKEVKCWTSFEKGDLESMLFKGLKVDMDSLMRIK